MRRKIAKRYKKKLRALGCEIRNPHFVSEPGWKRKDCGYSAEIIFKNVHICSIGFDELDCYKMAYEDVMEEIQNPFLTKLNAGSLPIFRKLVLPGGLNLSHKIKE